MTTLSSAPYSHTFPSDYRRRAPTASSSSRPLNPPVQVQVVQQQPEEQEMADEQYNTSFCRALYDYEAQDPSALSFRRDDIIEILTQQPSGWWDGLLGEERGWFPSNYVVIISDEEAEMAFAQAESPTADSQATQVQPTTSVDLSHGMSGGSQAEHEEWLDNEVSFRASTQETQPNGTQNGGQSSDFWMPEVTADGRIYYVNTQTGQRSRYLPQEAEDETSDSDLAGLTSQSTSRSGTSAGLFGLSDAAEPSSESDDATKPNGSPEIWVKRLADDGISHYYLNTIDGRVQWTAPELSSASATLSGRSNGALPSSISSQPDTSRLSVYSDDSDIQPFDHLSSSRPRQNNGASSRPMAGTSSRSEPNHAAVMELTSAERIAKALQLALEPPPPSLITDLAAISRSSIQAVVENLHSSGVVRQPEDDQKMDQLIYKAVLAVRNLLYIAAAPSSQASTSSGAARDNRTNSSSQSPLKPAQRKVTATLSRLVLSARAMQYDSGSQLADTLNRIETDSEELERAVLSFVLEVQRQENQLPETKPVKRLQGVFTTINVGLGLVGGGAAGSWNGFGYVAPEDESEMPQKVLGTEVISEIGITLTQLQEGFNALAQALRQTSDSSVQQVRSLVQGLVTRVSNFLSSIADVHVARHVDIDGIRQAEASTVKDRYSHSVENARRLVRTLETAVQAVYNDSAALLLTTQALHDEDSSPMRGEREASFDLLDGLSSSLTANLNLVKQTFEGLLSVGHEQADVAQGQYNGSIDWRLSRISAINDHFSSKTTDAYGSENEDVVDMELAFNGPGIRKQKSTADSSYDPYPSDAAQLPSRVSEVSLDITLVTHSPVDLREDFADNYVGLYDDEVPVAKPAARPSGANKLTRLLGDEYADKVAADLQPWYLRPNYSPSEITIETDGSVKGGTVPALVERLTAHEQADPTFSKAFLMTYKSFTTLDELFDLLVARFRIQPPETLTQLEREEWGKLKQHVIQMRVINTFKSMIVDEDVLEKEDLYILNRMKQFIGEDDVSRFAAAKSLQILIDRAQRGGGDLKTLVNTNMGPPPAAIVPKSNKKLKLSDIDPLELARQLTIMESQLYQKIKPMECLQRSREQRTENVDNITMVIQTSNRIADWVAESVLSKEDSRRRAQVIKHLIAVADRCRTLNNFSSMIAITSGLNTPPIRRLKRTWEQVNQRFMAMFGACEMTIDSNKNFTKYRQLMASVTPPCVPFIGVFLSTLTFIQDGNPDNLPGGLVNFRKRQMASEVINDIKRWQAQPFNFQPLPTVQSYINDSLNHFNDTRASSDHFWALSLEREPREREDEKMARLLQESGFL